MVRERDRIRRRGTDGTVQSGGPPAAALAARRASGAPRWHRPNRSVSTCTPTGATAPGIVDMLAPAQSERNAWCPLFQRVNRPIAPFISLRRSVKRTEYAPGATLMTMSNPCAVGRTSWRTISRNRRFNRLRSTAVCPCRGTMRPTLGNSRGEAHARIEKCRVRTTFPSC